MDGLMEERNRIKREAISSGRTIVAEVDLLSTPLTRMYKSALSEIDQFRLKGAKNPAGEARETTAAIIAQRSAV
jgi:hypothetical protein